MESTRREKLIDNELSIDDQGLLLLLGSGRPFSIDVGRTNDDSFPTLLCERNEHEGADYLRLLSVAETDRPANNIHEIVHRLYGANLDAMPGRKQLTAAIHSKCNGVISISYNTDEKSVSLTADTHNFEEIADAKRELGFICEVADVWLRLFSELRGNDTILRASLSACRDNRYQRYIDQEKLTDMQYYGFEGIGGLYEAKKRLKTIADRIKSSPEVRQKLQLPITPIFIYGEPGTGKSTIVDALGEEIDTMPQLYIINSLSQATSNLQSAIKKANQIPESHHLIQLDMIGLPEHQAVSEWRSFEHQLGIGKHTPNLTIVIESQQAPSTLNLNSTDFDVIQTTPPSAKERADIFIVLTHDQAIYDDNIDHQELGELCHDGITGEDIQKILLIAKNNKLDQYNETQELLPINHSDIAAAIIEYRRH